MNKISLFIICIALIISSCTTMDNRDYVANKDNNLTVAKAQSQLNKGMSGDEVVGVMGSPNIVTNDKDGNETWVYDKISTEHVSASSNGGLSILLAGLGGRSAAASSTQKTLTVIVKFDKNKKVSDIKYHQSAF